MLLNVLCYILVDIFDVFGVMGLLGDMLFNDADNLDPYDWGE